jgi:hypothetical protein
MEKASRRLARSCVNRIAIDHMLRCRVTSIRLVGLAMLVDNIEEANALECMGKIEMPESLRNHLKPARDDIISDQDVS